MSKFGVIGCGYWGKNIVRNVAKTGKLYGVADKIPANALREAEKYGVPSFSIDELLATDEVDGVFIVTPAETHKQIALQAIAAGKHVFVEKPLAVNVDDATQMRNAAQSADRIMMVGHLLQYHPAFATLRNQVHDGLLGELRYAYSNRLSLGKFRTEENALWSFAPHDVSMILSLFGEMPLHSEWTGADFLTDGIEDMTRLDMKFSNGRYAHIFASWLHPFKEQRLVVVGTQAMAVFEDNLQGPEKLRLYRHEFDFSGSVPAATKAEPEPIPYDNTQPLLAECEHFITCVENGLRPLTDAEEGLNVLSVLVSQKRSL